MPVMRCLSSASIAASSMGCCSAPYWSVLGATRVHNDCCLMDFRNQAGQVIATFDRPKGGERIEVVRDALIGADGIHSRVRMLLYPNEGPPVWNGTMLWRG